MDRCNICISIAVLSTHAVLFSVLIKNFSSFRDFVSLVVKVKQVIGETDISSRTTPPPTKAPRTEAPAV